MPEMHNVDLALRIAKKWEWRKEAIEELENAEALARNLDRVATGDPKPSRAVDAASIAQELHDVLLGLLRDAA